MAKANTKQKGRKLLKEAVPRNVFVKRGLLDRGSKFGIASNARWRRLLNFLAVEWMAEYGDAKEPWTIWMLKKINDWDGKKVSGPVPGASTEAGIYFNRLESAFDKRSRGWKDLNTETSYPGGNSRVTPRLRSMMRGSADDEGKTQAAQVVVENTDELNGP